MGIVSGLLFSLLVASAETPVQECAVAPAFPWPASEGTSSFHEGKVGAEKLVLEQRRLQGKIWSRALVSNGAAEFEFALPFTAWTATHSGAHWTYRAMPGEHAALLFEYLLRRGAEVEAHYVLALRGPAGWMRQEAPLRWGRRRGCDWQLESRLFWNAATGDFLAVGDHGAQQWSREGRAERPGLKVPVGSWHELAP